MRRILFGCGLALIVILLSAAGCLPRESNTIYFASERDGVGFNLYSLRVEGGAMQTLTGDLLAGWEPHPNLSPDGKQLVFVSAHLGGNLEVYTIGTDGTGLRRLTETPADEDRPSFTPDGRILFDSERSGDWEIWRMNADGSAPVQLTDSPGVDERAVMSPDGKLVCFVSERGGWYGLYLMNADGSGVRQLLAREGSWYNDPVWSPDGKRIAFSADLTGTRDIYTVGLDGGEPVDLTGALAWSDERYPAWSADGGRIAFAAYSDGDWELCSIPAEGGEVVTYTNNNTDDRFPVW